jgi:hypothetical protein
MPRLHNLTATFASRSQADRAVKRLRREGEIEVTVGSVDEAAALRAEMRDEIEATVIGPGNIGPFTKGMSKGLVRWLPIATLVGALLGLLIGLLPWPFDRGLTITVAVICGAVAGATTGFVAGGFVRPRKEGEGGEFAAERGVSVGIHTDDEGALERARAILTELGAERVDRVTPEGAPMGSGGLEETSPVRGEVPVTPEPSEERERRQNP